MATMSEAVHSYADAKLENERSPAMCSAHDHFALATVLILKNDPTVLAGRSGG